MSDSTQPTLLVTGASGHLGQRVLELLLEAGTGPIVATTRTPNKLAAFRQRGVIVRHADFDDPATLAEAFQGVDRLLLISTDATDQPGKRLAQHRAAVQAAQAAGVRHVIYTSLTNPGPELPVSIAPDHYGTEEALRASTLGWTMLRNNIYAEMLIGAVRNALQRGGKLFSAAGDGKAGYVTREDCARAAAAALAAPFEGQRVLDITGPAALSQADVAAIGSAVTGQPIEYIPLDLDVLTKNLVAAGLPQPVVDLITSFDAGIAQGTLDVTSSAVEDLTGRPPMSVRDFLAGQREAILAPPEAR